MSEHPRTDALLIEINEGRTYETVGLLTELCRALESDLAAARGREQKLKDCLEALCDIQNGPPLIRDTVAWNLIMKRAYVLIEAAPEAGKGEA